jgi:hypothetical protein
MLRIGPCVSGPPQITASDTSRPRTVILYRLPASCVIDRCRASAFGNLWQGVRDHEPEQTATKVTPEDVQRRRRMNHAPREAGKEASGARAKSSAFAGWSSVPKSKPGVTWE